MIGFAVRTVATALALWVAATIVSGIHVDGGWGSYVLIAALFGLVNGTVGTVLKFFTFPFVILSFGLMLLVINAAMLALTASALDTFNIDNFGSAILGSLIISMVGAPTALILKSAIGR